MTKAEKWMVGTNVALAAVAAGALFVAFQQTQSAREANDRTAGRIGARLEIVRVEPHPTEAQQFFDKVFPDDGKGERVFAPHFRDVEQLLLFNPRLVVRNTGSEIVEALRLETQRDFLFLIDPQKPGGGWADKLVAETCEREELTLSRKLHPGETAIVPVGKGLLKSMLDSNSKHADWKQCGKFTFACYARAVGQTGYDGADRNEVAMGSVVWYPSGFTDEKSKKHLDKTTSVVIGVPAKPIDMK